MGEELRGWGGIGWASRLRMAQGWGHHALNVLQSEDGFHAVLEVVPHDAVTVGGFCQTLSTQTHSVEIVTNYFVICLAPISLETLIYAQNRAF